MTHGSISRQSADNLQGSVGWPIDGVQTRLIADDGQDVSNVPDTMGEIQVKTPGLLKESVISPRPARI